MKSALIQFLLVALVFFGAFTLCSAGPLVVAKGLAALLGGG